MFDHVTITVSHIESTKVFYTQELVPLGYRALFGEEGAFWGFGKDRPKFWISQGDGVHPVHAGIHIAFACENRELVERFYESALAAGARDNGGPGVRTEYHEHYYGAFVLDPDGNNIEAVCHAPQKI